LRAHRQALRGFRSERLPIDRRMERLIGSNSVHRGGSARPLREEID
jgi:hypothetical protein